MQALVIIINAVLLLAPSHCKTRTKMFQSYWVKTDHGKFRATSQDLCVRESNFILKQYHNFYNTTIFRPYGESVHPFLCSLNLINKSPNAASAYSFGDGKCLPRKAHESVYPGPKHGLRVRKCPYQTPYNNLLCMYLISGVLRTKCFMYV